MQYLFFERRLKESPMIRKTLLLRGIAALLLLSGNYSLAQSNENNADSAQHYFQKALAEKEKGRKMEVLKHLEKANQFSNDDLQITAELAAAYHDLRKYDKALLAYKKLDEAGAATAPVYAQLLDLSFNMRRFDDVITYAGKLKALDKSASVSYYLGKVHYQQENYGEAIKQLAIASKEDPANAEVPYLVARSYADMMNYKQSIPYFQKAIELAPEKNNWIYELGLICYAMNDNKNALRYIKEAGDKGYKKDNDYLQNLAIAYLNTGKLDDGVSILTELLKKRPSDMNILNMVAEAYYYKGKYQQAIDYWDQILVYDKQNAEALYMIGMSYQKKGEKEKGIHLCDKAIEMDPSLASLKQKKMTIGGL